MLCSVSPSFSSGHAKRTSRQTVHWVSKAVIKVLPGEPYLLFPPLFQIINSYPDDISIPWRLFAFVHFERATSLLLLSFQSLPHVRTFFQSYSLLYGPICFRLLGTFCSTDGTLVSQHRMEGWKYSFKDIFSIT